jgi:ergothioneine biosynthesis protein EgtB
MNLSETYKSVRAHTQAICQPLKTEDYVVQPVVDVSPPKWHIGHVTWFFETFVLKPYFENYREFDPTYNYVFNSYYETVGARIIRTHRGNLSRPTVEDIYNYREHVDAAMIEFLEKEIPKRIQEIVVLGFNHEQQHQELLLTDIKYILGNNPLFPPYKNSIDRTSVPISFVPNSDNHYLHHQIKMEEGIYEIGYGSDGFCFDNELKKHVVFLGEYRVEKNLVTNQQYLEFMNDDAYKNFKYWHADGWEWVKQNKIEAPLYWFFIDGQWMNYTLKGLEHVALKEPVCHISYYEAAAFAAWKQMRLPTEFEWEAAANHFDWGRRWEWTESAYLPYPGFAKAPGAIGEYNGKFMVNQMVLRGASDVTSPGHSRITYRNFFQPNLRWQYTGIRLAQ